MKRGNLTNFIMNLIFKNIKKKKLYLYSGEKEIVLKHYINLTYSHIYQMPKEYWNKIVVL